MRTLRIPTSRAEITPELMADLVSNLRKLSNLSGSGCTVSELPNGMSINVPQPTKPQRGHLTAPLYGCSSATAVQLFVDANENQSTGNAFTVFDPLNKTDGWLLALTDVDGALYAPTGTCFEARWKDDSQQWELAEFGTCCPGSSGSESSGSESSGSESSGSESGSGGSSEGSSEGSSGSSGGSEESGKSTAIVPASWTKDGYTALFVMESPEVRFDDVVVVKVKGNTLVPIDPHFVEVCEPGSIEVCGIAPGTAVLVGASVTQDSIDVRMAKRKTVVRVVIRLTGIRKKFAGQRFPERSARQFFANERFINSAYPRK